MSRLCFWADFNRKLNKNGFFPSEKKISVPKFDDLQQVLANEKNVWSRIKQFQTFKQIMRKVRSDQKIYYFEEYHLEYRKF